MRVFRPKPRTSYFPTKGPSRGALNLQAKAGLDVYLSRKAKRLGETDIRSATRQLSDAITEAMQKQKP